VNRIVCDTNILLSGFVSNGSPRRVLERIEDGLDRAFTSRNLLIELDRVLSYPRVDKLLRRASVPRETVIRWMVERATIVLPKELQAVVVVDDPSDDHVLACAQAAGAEFIISGDAHLLKLHVWEGIPVVRAGAYLGKACK
jgi:putative PIN family toxin of toxin-antitoxin system